MPILTPLDVASYIYCPSLFHNKRQDILSKPLTFFESCVRAALIEGEKEAMLRTTSVTPRRLMKAWEKLWWPAVAKKGIPMTKADELTLKATELLTDYAQYDLSGYTYPTAGVYVGSETTYSKYLVQATADLLKTDATAKEKNTVLVNFTKRDLDAYQSALDPAVRCTAYMFYMGKGEAVSHINIYINTDNNKIKSTVSRFLPEDMEETKKMLYHVEQGIASKAFYPNPYACKGCNGCQNS